MLRLWIETQEMEIVMTTIARKTSSTRTHVSQAIPPVTQPVGKNRSKMRTRQQDTELQKTDSFSPEGFQFRREDWMDLRDPSRISSKAGVAFELLPQLVVKELRDDALDASCDVEFGLVNIKENSITFYVADEGPGLDGSDEEIAELYSIRRSLASSKMLRLPTRGMLGNGLRVVAGVVVVSEGWLRVSTRGRTLTLKPRREDGQTEITAVEPWEGTGTRVEVTLQGSLARHAIFAVDQGELFEWANEAKGLTGGEQYKSKSSAHWYDEAGFWELIHAAGKLRLGAFLERFLEGCTGKASEIAGDLADRPCDSLTREETSALLARSRETTRSVPAKRLGKVGRREDFFGYACESGTFEAHGAEIPFVVEAWANRADGPSGMVCVNRTPVCAEVYVRRDEGSDYAILGCQLQHRFNAGRKSAGEYRVLVNVAVPRHLSEEQRRLLEEFEQHSTDHTYKEDAGFFDKIRAAFR